MKVRKKPVEVEAEQLTRQICGKMAGLSTFFRPKDGRLRCISYYADHAVIETIEGRLRVDIGDWIITGVHGERYPCKPEIFAETYEVLSDESTAYGTDCRGGCDT